MDAKEFHAAARRIEGLQRKLCETEVERDAWKRSYQDLSKSAHRELTEVRVTARQEIERTREEQRNVWREMLGALPQESLTEAINRVVMTKAERDKLSALIDEQRRLLAAKQTEIGALEAERDDLRKVVEMVHADLGIQRGDHVGEAISELKKEASDATARQRMTEARALNYSLQAEEARRETERLRGEVATLVGDRQRLKAELAVIKDERNELRAKCDSFTKERDGLMIQSTMSGPTVATSICSCTKCVRSFGQAWSDVPNATQWVEDMRGNTEASHDTPAGKEAAEAVVRDSQMTDTHDCGPNCPHCSW